MQISERDCVTKKESEKTHETNIQRKTRYYSL